jgi:hypothetical protein
MMNPLSKTKFQMVLVAFLFAVTTMWTGCDNKTATNTDNPPQDSTAQVTPPDSPTAMKVLKSVPSPIQMAFYLLNSKSPYNEKLMNPTANLDKYSNSFAQAMNLGVYQADLGYAIAHGQTQQSLNYLEAVKTLGDKLGILNSFEKSMIERAEDNLDNKDSLFSITTDAFKDAETYLNQNARPEIADLIVIGGWLESTYLATQTAKTGGGSALRRRIGEDKLVLPGLIAIMESHNGGKDFLALTSKLKDLAALYDQIKVMRKYQPAETDREAKVTRINSKSQIRYSKDLLTQITDKVAAIRNLYIQ